MLMEILDNFQITNNEQDDCHKWVFIPQGQCIGALCLGGLLTKEWKNFGKNKCL